MNKSAHASVDMDDSTLACISENEYELIYKHFLYLYVLCLIDLMDSYLWSESACGEHVLGVFKLLTQFVVVLLSQRVLP